MTAAAETPKARTVDMKLEVVVIPVSDVDRAKRFYGGLGWRLDADFAAGGLAGHPVHAARLAMLGHLRQQRHRGGARLRAGTVPDRLRHRGRPRRPARARGCDRRGVSRRRRRACRHGRALSVRDAPGQRSGSGAGSYGSYASFKDPDGNGWLFQEITARLPGRVDASDTTFTSSNELAAALRRAAAAHGEHEKRTGGKHDENWPDWYADYIVKEQAGRELPT